MILKRKKYESNYSNRNTARPGAAGFQRTASPGASSTASFSGARWSDSGRSGARWPGRSG